MRQGMRACMHASAFLSYAACRRRRPPPLACPPHTPSLPSLNSSAGPAAAAMKLSAATVGQFCQGAPLSDVQRLDCSSKGLTEIVDLSSLKSLARLDVSGNALTSLDGVGACTALRWLSAAGNAVASLDNALRDLEGLEVLNAAKNQLEGKVQAGRLKALKALILNNNRVTLVGGACAEGRWGCWLLAAALAAFPCSPACCLSPPAGCLAAAHHRLLLSHTSLDRRRPGQVPRPEHAGAVAQRGGPRAGRLGRHAQAGEAVAVAQPAREPGRRAQVSVSRGGTGVAACWLAPLSLFAHCAPSTLFFLPCPPPHPVCRACPLLKELRLSHNKLPALPAELAANERLRILEAGGNPITSFSDIQVGCA